MGIRIVHGEKHERISFGKAILRYFGYSASALTLGFGYIMVGFHGKKRGLHDLIANTYVIHE